MCGKETVDRSEQNHHTSRGLAEQKNILRERAYAARRTQQDRERIGHRVCERLMKLPEYRCSHTVLWYLNHRSELPTEHVIPEALESGKRIVVPYCHGDRLHLWLLRALEELVPGSYGIPEPPSECWADPERRIDDAELDFIVVPGVGFDRKGNRLGNGQGYYDRLLADVRSETMLVGLCYESQMFDRIPVGPHDVPMHKIITERQIYSF